MKTEDQSFQSFIESSEQCLPEIMKLKICDQCIPCQGDFSNIWNIKKNYEKSNKKHSVTFQPKKSRSTNSILSEERSKSSRKRHSWGLELEKLQRYNTGDFLRQQILEDLDSPEIVGKSEDQIAADRYQRIRAYLDQRSKPLIRSWAKCIKFNSSENEDSFDNQSPTNNRKIKRRFSDYYRHNHKKDRSNHRTRRVRSDANVRLIHQYPQKQNYRRTRSESHQKFISEDCRRNSSRNNWINIEMLKLRNLAMKNRSISCPEKNWIPGQQIAYNFNEALEFESDEFRNSEGDETGKETITHENYLQVERNIPEFQMDQNVPIELSSLDTGYDSIPKGLAKAWMGFRANSNVKKSDTFRIVDGSEGNEWNVFGGNVEEKGEERGFLLIHRTDDDTNNKSHQSVVDNDIVGDYSRSVYDLLKRQQKTGTRRNDKSCDPVRNEEETDSENFCEVDVRQRRRRKKRDQVVQGEELVVSSGTGGREAFCRPQLRDITPNKRRPPPPPPVPSKYKINHRDISKYFDYPNKENRPGYVSSENQVDLTLEMGSNLSRHSGKGLTGRRTQSSGNLCDPKGKLNHVGKILVPCSSGPEERYKMSGSLPNSLDDKESLANEPLDNNNVISDTISGNMGGTLPHKKRAHGVHFSDDPTETLDLVKNQSQESLEGDPWRYQQSSDLDLVRCKHGNYDLVRKNQSLDTVDSGIKYTRVFPDDKYHNHHFDLVGTLPKRRIDPKWCDPSSIQAFQQQSTVNSADGDLLMKVVHKPGCELMKHRQLERPGDIKTTRLAGEHQDQGYASERSPEEEHPPFLPGHSFPNVDPESTYRVILQKSSRGLGLSVSGGGTAGPVRVKRLFPQQPAALSNKLQPGDILLAANGVPLTGLTNYEALEVLRTTSNTVELLVCRLPGEEPCISPPGAPPPPPLRREPPPPPVRLLNPLPLLQIEPCGEFDIEMTKVGGSLGFTLRKVDSSALGHYVRALVREPALSDGRIQPGDKIVAVDGAPLSPMSHEEAVALLRQCGPRVKLRLYRDLAQTPVSALSPTEPDHPLRPPRTSLRQEAVDMLCDLAVRKLTPGTSNGSGCQNTSGTSTSSPRRLRRPASRTPTGEREHEPIYSSQVSTASQADTSDSDQCSIKTQITNSQAVTPDDIIDPPALYDISDSNDRPLRPNFLNLSAPMDKPNFQFSLESESEKTIVMGKCNTIGNVETVYVDENRRDMAGDMQDNDLPSEPASMPPMMSSVRTNSGAFSYKNPAYQSANPTCGGTDNSAKSKIGHSSDQDIPGKVLSVEDPVGSKGLLKWKGVMFAPDDEEEKPPETTGNSRKTEPKHREGYEVFMVELTRGWNSRLGFSLQSNGDSTVISMVHPDSVAAKDGRLKQGDVLIMVNDESVEDVPTAEIIDLLRKIRGSIGITIARKKRGAT